MRPRISIVIPTYNRPERLKSCLEAISELDYPQEQFEVIVVDDGSPTPVNKIVEPFANVKLFVQTNAGPARARNRGAREAIGEFLAFTDDDCRPAPGWLNELEAASRSLPYDTAIGGRTINALDSDPYAAASQLLVDYLYENQQRRTGDEKRLDGSFFTSNNVLFGREMFLRIGGFSDKFRHAAGEDREICNRWVAHGGTLKFAPEAIILHYHSMSWNKFVRQHFTYGRGAYHYHRLKAGGTGSPLDESSFGFYHRILLYPFGKSLPQSPIFVAALLAVSQVANAAGFFFELSNQKTLKNRLSASTEDMRSERAEPVRDLETVSKS
jgi:Predicted glycosyltransferases